MDGQGEFEKLRLAVGVWDGVRESVDVPLEVKVMVGEGVPVLEGVRLRNNCICG